MITSELTNTDIFIRIALSLIAGMVIGMERVVNRNQQELERIVSFVLRHV